MCQGQKQKDASLSGARGKDAHVAGDVEDRQPIAMGLDHALGRARGARGVAVGGDVGAGQRPRASFTLSHLRGAGGHQTPAAGEQGREGFPVVGDLDARGVEDHDVPQLDALRPVVFVEKAKASSHGAHFFELLFALAKNDVDGRVDVQIPDLGGQHGGVERHCDRTQ